MIGVFILYLFGLIGFVAAMCVIIYFFWRRSKDEPLPDGDYHIKFAGYNNVTGDPEYDMTLISDQDIATTGKGTASNNT